MGTTEIVLLVIGSLFFVISFFLPDGKKKKEEKITADEIKALIDKEMESAKSKIEDMVDETVNYSVEKTERALERLSNEKIMAVDEYSETVLKKINDNHQEAVFLYDMLNDKDEKLKNTGEELKADRQALEDKEKELKSQAEKIEIEKSLIESIKEEAIKEEANKSKTPEPEFKPFASDNLEVVNISSETVEEAPKASPKKKTATKRAEKSTAKPKKTFEEVSVHFESDNDGRKNSNELIRKLHEEGKTNMQIARELGLGVGEVKLVIDLFANRK